MEDRVSCTTAVHKKRAHCSLKYLIAHVNTPYMVALCTVQSSKDLTLSQY